MINSEELKVYLTALGLVSCFLIPYLVFQLYRTQSIVIDLQDKYWTALTQRDTLRDKIECITETYQNKVSEFQSKRDKHKQEQSSWAKQRINLKKRIKEL